MAKSGIEISEENKTLRKENKKLRQKLSEARTAIDLVKTGSVDALVYSTKDKLKVYTEQTADKTYRILIEEMHEGALTLNKEGIILYCNSCFSHMLGRPLQKVIGASLADFIDAGSKQRFEALIKQGWKQHIKNEVALKGKEGKTVPVLMSVNTLSLDTDLVLSIILTDLTIRNKNREELETKAAELSIAKTDAKKLGELNTHKESVLATLSHDLRSPLAGIIGMADLLRNNFHKLETGKVKQMLDLLYKATTDELNMLDSLVEWARIKYASETFNPVNIQLSQSVDKVFKTLNENAVANELSLNNQIDGDIAVVADEKMLLSILQNIISNSIKHTPAGGQITVSAERGDDKITVQVKDTGIGMSEKIREKLFTLQMKTLSNAREENKGAGIGLLLVKGFLEKIGGEIWLESVEGKGTSFYFTLPVSKPEDKSGNTEKVEFAH